MTFEERMSQIKSSSRNYTAVATTEDVVEVVACPALFHLWPTGHLAKVVSVSKYEDGEYAYSCQDVGGIVQILIGDDIVRVV